MKLIIFAKAHFCVDEVQAVIKAYELRELCLEILIPPLQRRTCLLLLLLSAHRVTAFPSASVH